MEKELQNAQVIDNTEDSRFEMDIEGYIAYILYTRNHKVLKLLHTEVPSPLEGRGIGTLLVKKTLDEIKELSLKIVPACPFIKDYISKNQEEYNDLIQHSDNK